MSGNRAAKKWSRRELLGRLVWETLGAFVFRLTPRPMWGVRRAILRIFGAEIGVETHLYPTVRVAIPWNLSVGSYTAIGDRVILYSLGTITIGSNVTISQGAHDFRDPSLPLQKIPISVQDGAWVCADAFLGPGVSIGELAVVGARAAVMRDVAPSQIVAGNPATQIGTRDVRPRQWPERESQK
ncbi:MAG: hypothetical protein CFE32_21185 [Alphaproteobacteria bacterium PA3]|nr:MAG: hypothetical protein CFE32_21185 [Alphaproteobacteria bacterium PA3]